MSLRRASADHRWLRSSRQLSHTDCALSSGEPVVVVDADGAEHVHLACLPASLQHRGVGVWGPPSEQPPRGEANLVPPDTAEP